MARPSCSQRLATYPSSLEQLPAELFSRVIECELFTAEMIDRWVALQVQEQIVVKAHFFWFFLVKSDKNITFTQCTPSQGGLNWFNPMVTDQRH